MWWWTLPAMALSGLAGLLVRRAGRLERDPAAMVRPGDNLRARATAARVAAVAVTGLQERTRALNERLDRPAGPVAPPRPPAPPGAETPGSDH